MSNVGSVQRGSARSATSSSQGASATPQQQLLDARTQLTKINPRRNLDDFALASARFAELAKLDVESVQTKKYDEETNGNVFNLVAELERWATPDQVRVSQRRIIDTVTSKYAHAMSDAEIVTLARAFARSQERVPTRSTDSLYDGLHQETVTKAVIAAVEEWMPKDLPDHARRKAPEGAVERWMVKLGVKIYSPGAVVTRKPVTLSTDLGVLDEASRGVIQGAISRELGVSLPITSELKTVRALVDAVLAQGRAGPSASE